MDPERLLDGEGDDFARALLRSAGRDEPDHGAAARAVVALGVGAGIVGASGTATAGGVGAASAGIGVGALGIAKWVGIGVVAGLFTAGGVDLARRSTAVSPPAEVDLARRTTVSSPPADARAVSARLAGAHHADVAANPAPPSPVLLQPPRQPGPLGFVPTAKPAAAPDSSAVAAFAAVPLKAAAPAPSLGSEVAALARVQSALSRRDPGGALRELDAYENRAHGVVLATEAGVLRAEAWLQSGDRARASALASRLLASEPNGPHAARLRAIAAESNR